MSCLALNVYCWGKDPQNRLLTGFLAPALRALRAEGLVRRYWSTRFDSRGPHLLVVLSTPPGREGELRERLGAGLAAWLADHPSTERLSPEEVLKRHEECRGKELCALDREPGIAPDNSFAFAPHGGRDYPFFHYAGSPASDELWELAADLGLWLLERLGEGAGTGLAVRWIADVDGALARAGADAAAAWRMHATTLLLPLAERLRAEEAAVLAALPASVGERNRQAFARVWAQAEGAPPAWPGLDRLVRLALEADRGGGEALAFLREVNHCALKQLDQPVMLHVPLILYAWQRNLPPRGADRAPAAPAAAGTASTSSTTATATAW